MALPTSGPLSMSQIRTEFGGSNPVSLSQYYRGGALVPSSVANIQPTSADTTNVITESGNRFFYNLSSPLYYAQVIFYTEFGLAEFSLYWNNTLIDSGVTDWTQISDIDTSVTYNGTTYFRTIADQDFAQDPEFPPTETFWFGVRRETGTVSVNELVPTSPNTIKIGDFYGAKKSL